MFDCLLTITIFAQADGGGQAGDSPGPFSLVFPVVMIFVLFYLLILRPQKRDRAKRDETLKTLKKNDRVVTIGGILGSIANVEPDGKEVTVKVDDNTRIRMLRSSIQTVLKDDDDEQASK